MKRVMLRDRGMMKAREVVTTILEQPTPGQGVTYADMRKRMRLQDILERAKNQNYVDLEDADHAALVALLNAFQFGIAKRELTLILDDVVEAKAPEDTLQLKLLDDAG